MLCAVASPCFRGAIALTDQGGDSLFFQFRVQGGKGMYEREGIRKKEGKGRGIGRVDKEGKWVQEPVLDSSRRCGLASIIS